MPATWRLCFALCLALAAPVAARATVVRDPSLAELTSLASRIVVGEVADVRVDGGGMDDELPITLVTLRVIETLKGPASVQLVLEFPGGRRDGVSLAVDGVPSFQPGDRDILFLHESGPILSPVLGVFAGRFRLSPATGSGDATVRAHDGLDLSPAFVGREGEAPRGAGTVTLSMFRRAVHRLLLVPTAVVQPVFSSERQAARSFPARFPDCVRVDLGPAPTLANRCPDWSCVVGRAVDTLHHVLTGLRAPRVASSPVHEDACQTTANIRWATAIHGRALDRLTLAVTLHRETPGARETTVFLNAGQVWNAWDRETPADEALTSVDAVSVLAESLLGMTAQLVEMGGAAPPRAFRIRGRLAGPSPLNEARSDSSMGAAADPCQGGSGAMVNPRMLVFVSPDHERMTAYQVGFFLPRAQGAVSVIDVPLDAFLERLVFDLPQGDSDAMQRTLVAGIASAGLATPIGHLYTYRVRGVWPGGTTAWSAPSPLFVRCR
jgi:hypothetical protein